MNKSAKSASSHCRVRKAIRLCLRCVYSDRGGSNTNRYLTDSAKEQHVLVLSQLDFYDAAGRQLEQIPAAGKLGRLGCLSF
jgi:hypothetical protein